MIKKFKDFERFTLNEGVFPPGPLAIVKNALHKWMSGWKTPEQIDSQFDKFVETQKANFTSLLHLTWCFLLWNTITKKDVENNPLLSELNDILNSTRPSGDWVRADYQLEKNATKLVSDLFGHANGLIGSIRRSDYKKASDMLKVILERYVNQPGLDGLITSIFTDEGIARMKSFKNTLGLVQTGGIPAPQATEQPKGQTKSASRQKAKPVVNTQEFDAIASSILN